MSDCWPNYENCEVHRPGRSLAAEVPGSIACLAKPGCVFMHGHRGACSYDAGASGETPEATP